MKPSITSGSSAKIASSAAALTLNILDGDAGDAPKQDTWINLIMPPCSLAICTDFKHLESGDKINKDAY